jgi:hypothetical protein
MNKCSCGSAAVRADIHSFWCDSLNKATHVFDVMTRKMNSSHMASVVYICTDLRDPKDVYNKFKDQYKEKWLWTTETDGVFTCQMANLTEIIFIASHNLHSIRFTSPDIYYIEDSYSTGLLIEQLEENEKSQVFRVDPLTLHVLYV